MSLRSLFTRRPTTTVVSPSVTEPQTPPTPEHLTELEEAWAELAQAAKGSGVNSFHACSRNGKPWQEDPAAVRSMAALLRRLGEQNTAAEAEPAG